MLKGIMPLDSVMGRRQQVSSSSQGPSSTYTQQWRPALDKRCQRSLHTCLCEQVLTGGEKQGCNSLCAALSRIMLRWCLQAQTKPPLLSVLL